MSPFQVPNGPYDIDQVMDEIRRQIVEPQQQAEAPAARVHDGSARSERAAYMEALGRLAQLDVGYQIQSHRPVYGRFVDLIKRLIHWGSRPYTDMVRERQAEFNANLVSALGVLAREIDRLDEGRKKLEEEAESGRKHFEAAQAGFDADLKRLYARHDVGPFFASIPAERRLEGLNRTRGDADSIGRNQAHYAALFEGAPGPVLDIGCGRGELLGQLRQRGIECLGAEIDPLMVEEARRRGVSVEQINGLEALRKAQDGSLGGVFAAQVVEHLFPGELGELLMLARRKVATGGTIILETVNVASPGAVHKSFYRDMDHKLPIHPEYLKLLLELVGFEEVELHYSAPFSAEERLADLPSAEEMGVKPAARRAMQGVVDQVNEKLCGMQDYYVVGRVKSEG